MRWQIRNICLSGEWTIAAQRVRADFDQLATLSRSFSHQAELTSAMLSSLKGKLEILQSGDWVGQGAQAFYGEMNSSVLPALQRLTRALTNASATTLKINQLMKQADDDVAALFKGGLAAGTPGAGQAEAGSAGSAGGASTLFPGEAVPMAGPKGRVVRVERPRTAPDKARLPPGPGAYTEQELKDWIDNHPFAGTLEVTMDNRTRQEVGRFSAERMWKKGYYYARTEVDPQKKTRTVIWVNDDEDNGKGAVVRLVRTTK